MVATQATVGFLAGFCTGHPIFGQFEVFLADARFPLGHVHTTAGRAVGKASGRNLYIHADFMVKAQIFVDIGSCDLAGGNRLDDGGGTAFAVAAHEHAI